jgi:hypothetical protein
MSDEIDAKFVRLIATIERLTVALKANPIKVIYVR